MISDFVVVSLRRGDGVVESLGEMGIAESD